MEYLLAGLLVALAVAGFFVVSGLHHWDMMSRSMLILRSMVLIACLEGAALLVTTANLEDESLLVAGVAVMLLTPLFVIGVEALNTYHRRLVFAKSLVEGRPVPPGTNVARLREWAARHGLQ